MMTLKVVWDDATVALITRRTFESYLVNSLMRKFGGDLRRLSETYHNSATRPEFDNVLSASLGEVSEELEASPQSGSLTVRVFRI